MASIEDTKTGYAVKWRLGGKRTGAPQTLTIKLPASGRTAGAWKLAEAVRDFVEARHHAVTRAEAYGAVVDPDAGADATPTFAQWVPAYIAGRRGDGDAQPDTLDRYGQVLSARAVPYLGHRRLSEITPEVVEEWVKWVARTQRSPAGKPLSAETVRRAHAILHGCLGAAVPRWLAANPAARPAGSRRAVPGLPRPQPYQGMFLEPWEVDVILANCPAAIADMVEVAVRTGLRLGELLVLRVRDVVLTGRRPHIDVVRALKDDGSVGTPKSAKSKRKVTVAGRAKDVLAARVADKRPDQLIFTAPRGGLWSETNLRNRFWVPTLAAARRCAAHPPPLPAKPARGLRRGWRPDEVSTCMCAGRLKRTPRWHDLRHTHASLLIEAGWTPKRVQLRMGHATFVITMDIYGHLWERDDVGRLDEVDRLLAGGEGEVADGRAAALADDERA